MTSVTHTNELAAVSDLPGLQRAGQLETVSTDYQITIMTLLTWNNGQVERARSTRPGELSRLCIQPWLLAKQRNQKQAAYGTERHRSYVQRGSSDLQ